MEPQASEPPPPARLPWSQSLCNPPTQGLPQPPPGGNPGGGPACRPRSGKARRCQRGGGQVLPLLRGLFLAAAARVLSPRLAGLAGSGSRSEPLCFPLGPRPHLSLATGLAATHGPCGPLPAERRWKSGLSPCPPPPARQPAGHALSGGPALGSPSPGPRELKSRSKGRCPARPSPPSRKARPLRARPPPVEAEEAGKKRAGFAAGGKHSRGGLPPLPPSSGQEKDSVPEQGCHSIPWNYFSIEYGLRVVS